MAVAQIESAPVAGEVAEHQAASHYTGCLLPYWAKAAGGDTVAFLPPRPNLFEVGRESGKAGEFARLSAGFDQQLVDGSGDYPFPRRCLLTRGVRE